MSAPARPVSRDEWAREASGDGEHERLAAGLEDTASDRPEGRQRRSPESPRPRRDFRRGQTLRAPQGTTEDAIGAGHVPLPGGRTHLVNHPVPEHPPLEPPAQRPYYDGIMAHGVEVTDHPHGGRPRPKPHERARLAATRRGQLPESPAEKIDPIPVTIHSTGSGRRPLKRTAFRSATVPAPGTTPDRVVGRDPRRSRVGLLNEDPANAIRLTFNGDADSSRGVYLPPGMSNYLWLHTQDVIWAIMAASNGSTATAVTGAFAAGAAGSAALPAGASLTGFTVTAAQVTTAESGTVTITGLAAGTLTYNFVFPNGANSTSVLNIDFPQALAAANPTTAVTVAINAVTGGSAGNINVYGQATPNPSSSGRLSIVYEYEVPEGTS